MDKNRFLVKNNSKMDMFKMLLSGCAVGIFAALVAVAYRYVLGISEIVRPEIFEKADSIPEIIAIFAVLIILGLIVGKISKDEPLIKGSGIPQVEGQLMGYFSPVWWKILIKKFITGTICIASGLSLGREGPSVQLGGMAGQGLAEAFGADDSDKRYLIVCGACAGLAAAFNAPLAGLMFALEEIHKSVSRRSVFPAMAAAMCADVVSKLFFGKAAVLNMINIETLPLKYYALYIVMGILCGALGWFYNTILFMTQKLYKKIPVSDTVRIAIPFVIAGIVGFTFPAITGGGHGIIELLAAGQAAFSLMLALLVGKFLFSMVCFCSGAPGGIFFPLLVLGALVGSLAGKAGVFTFGFPESYVINFMLLGMAGLFAGIVRAPITGIVLVAEMSGSLTQFIGLAMVSCIACLVASVLGSRPVYEQMLENITPDSVRDRKSQNLAVMDVTVPLNNVMEGKRIKDLNLPESCHIVGINRYEISLIPNGMTIINCGDILSIVYKAGTEQEVLDSMGIYR